MNEGNVAKHEGQIPLAMDKLEKNIGYMEERVKQVLSRLEPVRAQSNPIPSDPEKLSPDNRPSCPMVMALSEFANTVNEASRILNVILDTLEV